MHKLFATYINYDLRSIADEDKINNFLSSCTQIFLKNGLPDNSNLEQQPINMVGGQDTLQETYGVNDTNLNFENNLENHLKTISLFTLEDYLNQYSKEVTDLLESKKSNEFKLDKEIYIKSESLIIKSKEKKDEESMKELMVTYFKTQFNSI